MEVKVSVKSSSVYLAELAVHVLAFLERYDAGGGGGGGRGGRDHGCRTQRRGAVVLTVRRSCGAAGHARPIRRADPAPATTTSYTLYKAQTFHFLFI